MMSEARVATTKPARYLKQLCSHFGHRVPAEATEERGAIRFSFGVCELRVEPEALILRAEADDEEAVARLEGVVGSHLERFGQKDGLQVRWSARG